MDDREMLLVLTIVRLSKGKVVDPYRVEIVYQEEENKLRQWRSPQTKQLAVHHNEGKGRRLLLRGAVDPGTVA